MPHSDDFDLSDDGDESAFIALATQVEASQGGGFQASPRPAKRRRLNESLQQLDGAGSVEHEWSDADEQAHGAAKLSLTATHPESQPEAEDDPDYYFPGELEGPDDQPAKNTKYKIHVPKNGGQYEDLVVTQTQYDLDSSPSRFRGAVWKKPKPAPPPFINRQAPNRNGAVQGNGSKARPQPGSKQMTLNGMNGFTAKQSNGITPGDHSQNDANLAARLQAEENALSNLLEHGSQSGPVYPPTFDVSNELADLPSDAFSSSSPEKSPQKRVPGLRGPQHGLKQMTIFGQPATQDMSASQAATKKHAWPLKSREEKPTHHKLDEDALKTWVYPTNLGKIRDYQYNIVSRSLYTNTLVALPTGLGKTFIAATVMFNYHRWTKDAQIVFMAPTKPLIAQQMDACYHIVGIPRRDTVLMTGETSPALRAEEWLEKRVFFMTPQTVMNDLKTGIADPKKVVLAVIDEAHKATGGYAYTEVVAFLRRFNSSFRVLALTATPGSTVEAVQAVINNLDIARVELRTEQSIDIRPYTHEKHTETELFDYNDEQVMVMDLMSKAVRPVLEKLCSQNAYWSRDPMNLSAYGLNTARVKWLSSDAGRKAPQGIRGMVQAMFAVLASLAHSIGLLKNHGIGPFYSGVLSFKNDVDSGQSKGKYATQIAQHEAFVKMMSFIRGWTSNVDFIGHPKLHYLREVVLNHFLDAGEGRQGADVPPSATRVMVFTSYRDSTDEICRVLKRNEPMIRPHVFVGQAASKGSEGMDQKRQNAVIQDFKAGKYNTLIATSIGEEGLDIGDVDLIVCYDASSSPIRMLQRIGRTGRKRIGKVTLLLMKGKEENDYAKAQDNYAYIQQTIADETKYIYKVEESPRILPKGVKPVPDKRIIDIPIENSQPIDLNERGKRAKGKGKAKRPPKKFHMPDGVRTGFVKASKMDSDEDESGEERVPKRKTSVKRKTPAKSTKPAPEPEVPPVQVPFLEDVLLNTVQQRELERKYTHTADDEADLTIRAPDPTRFPESLRRMGPTKYVRHGKRSLAFEQTMRAIAGVDGGTVQKMEHVLDMTYIQHVGNAAVRIANAVPDVEDDGERLPSIPFPVPKAKKVTKPQQKKRQPNSAAAENYPEESDRMSGTKKPRGLPKKKQPAQRITYGSDAAEGIESSPEPTPANMRIGTQGIDLGSADTSGEEEEEKPDSELDEFIVRSDQPIEMASSSQRLPDDTQPSREKEHRSRGLKNAANKLDPVFSDNASGSEKENEPEVVSLENDSEIEDPPIVKVRKGKTRRIVGESDSDE